MLDFGDVLPVRVGIRNELSESLYHIGDMGNTLGGYAHRVSTHSGYENPPKVRRGEGPRPASRVSQAQMRWTASALGRTGS